MHIVWGIVQMPHTMVREQIRQSPCQTVVHICILITYIMLFVWITYLPGISMNSTRVHFLYIPVGFDKSELIQSE